MGPDNLGTTTFATAVKGFELPLADTDGGAFVLMQLLKAVSQVSETALDSLTEDLAQTTILNTSKWIGEQKALSSADAKRAELVRHAVKLRLLSAAASAGHRVTAPAA